MSEINFFEFIGPILESRTFDWLGLLGYLPESHRPAAQSRRVWEEIWEVTDPKRFNWKKTPETAWECFDQWREETGIGPGLDEKTGQDCIWLEEFRTKGEVRYHVLVDEWEGTTDSPLLLWKEISGGWAYSRPLGERIAGLLGHMVMRAGCSLEVRCGRIRGTYTHEDFRPWRPKS